MSQPPRNRDVRPVQNRNRPANARPRNVNAAPKRDTFPYIMGGVIGALVVGLMVVVYLIGQNSGGGGTTGGTTGGSGTTGGTTGGTQPTAATGGNSAAGTPPRMEIKEFAALYNSDKPPLVLDVRPKAAFDEGHIKGAVSVPEAEVDARVAELPKDRLIVAYCQ